jgi:hypothetical protein
MKTSIIRLYGFFFILSTCAATYAQTAADSIQAVQDALQLIALPEPSFATPFTATPSPKDIADMGFEQPNTSEAVTYTMRDGTQIHGQRYASDSERTVLLASFHAPEALANATH